MLGLAFGLVSCEKGNWKSVMIQSITLEGGLIFVCFSTSVEAV